MSTAPPADAAPSDEDLDDDAGSADLDMKLLDRYRELRLAAGASEAEAKALKAEADKLEQQVVEMLGDAGVQNMNVNGSTIYLHRTTWAQRTEGVTTEALMDALREAGEGDLVKSTINAQTLSAWVREHLDRDDPKPLPEPVAELLELGEKFAARIRTSSSSARRPRKS